MRLHHDEKVGITKRLTENIGAVLKTRLVEEEITIHTVTAPLVSYKPVNITKLKQDLKKHKKQVNGEFQRNMESSLLAYDPLTRRQILSGIHRKVKRMKSGVDKELKALRLKDRICKMCKKTRLDCRCKGGDCRKCEASRSVSSMPAVSHPWITSTPTLWAPGSLRPMSV